MKSDKVDRPALAVPDRDRGAGFGVEISGQPMRQAMQQRPDDLVQRGLRLGRLSQELPRGVLGAGDRALFARRARPALESLGYKVARALELSSFDVGTRPGDVRELALKRERYTLLQRLGGRIKNIGLNLRLCFGAQQWMMINRTVEYLEKRFSDPAITRAEIETLLLNFGPMLIKLDEVSRKAPERKEALFEERKRLAAEVKAAQDAAARAEVELDIRRGQTPAREKLLAAARHWQAEQAKTSSSVTSPAPAPVPAVPGYGSAAAQPGPGPAGPRKVIR